MINETSTIRRSKGSTLRCTLTLTWTGFFHVQPHIRTIIVLKHFLIINEVLCTSCLFSNKIFSFQTSSGSVIYCKLWLKLISRGMIGLINFFYKNWIRCSYFSANQGCIIISLIPLYPNRFLDVLASNFILQNLLCLWNPPHLLKSFGDS